MKFIPIIPLFVLSAVFLNSNAQDIFPNKGLASFYSDKFEGRTMANGQRFRQSKPTCAHRSLPFGTKLEVVNPENNKSVLVTVTDRGPFVKGRIIDLSKSAARALDMMQEGHTEVLLYLSPGNSGDTVISPLDSGLHFFQVTFSDLSDTIYAVRLASFASAQRTLDFVALAEKKLERQLYFDAHTQRNPQLYRVYAGKYFRREEAEELLRNIRSLYPDARIIRILITGSD